MKPGELHIGYRGLVLAALVFSAWLLTLALFGQMSIGWEDAFWIPLVIALRSFLNVGLFITAHDAMHGTLYPSNLKLNHRVGTWALMLYAGFSYSTLLKAHIAHHDAPGTDEDPDFARHEDDGFWRWFTSFMLHYASWQQYAVMVLYTGALVLWSVSIWNVVVFWGIPAILSAIQLFYFGTYQPHRREALDFEDNHRARTVERSEFLSFITCFHFGYHLEHHRYPWVPWWALPKLRRALGKTESSGYPKAKLDVRDQGALGL